MSPRLPPRESKCKRLSLWLWAGGRARKHGGKGGSGAVRRSIYENGVLKPAKFLPLQEHVKLQVTVKLESISMSDRAVPAHQPAGCLLSRSRWRVSIWLVAGLQLSLINRFPKPLCDSWN
jgi:hypothetical protein